MLQSALERGFRLPTAALQCEGRLVAPAGILVIEVPDEDFKSPGNHGGRGQLTGKVLDALGT